MARSLGFALLGESLFLVWPRKSNPKEGHPCIRVLLRKTSLPSGAAPGVVAKGHPCPITPHSASMPRVPLRSTYARPSEGESSPSCLKVCEQRKNDLLIPDKRTTRRRRTPLSAGRMESTRRGASGMDAARGVKGQGWPLYAGPRSGDGMREVERSETRMQGQDFLLTFWRLKKVRRPAGRNQAIKPLGSELSYGPRFKHQNEKDHAWAWSFRFVGPMVTASSLDTS